MFHSLRVIYLLLTFSRELFHTHKPNLSVIVLMGLMLLWLFIGRCKGQTRGEHGDWLVESIENPIEVN